MCGDYETDKQPAQWLLRHKRTLHERTPSHEPYKAAVIILVKRFRLTKGKIGVEASKELLLEIGTGRSASSDQK